MAELCDEEAFDAQSLSPRSPEVPYDGTPVRLKPRQAVIETSSSDSDLPRWCYDEHLATRRKKKRLGGPSPLTATGATNHQNYDDRESDLSEIKHLLTVLSSKVEQNEKTLKDMRDERYDVNHTGSFCWGWENFSASYMREWMRAKHADLGGLGACGGICCSEVGLGTYNDPTLMSKTDSAMHYNIIASGGGDFSLGWETRVYM